MSEHIIAGAPEVAVTLRHSARARRISLRISQLDGRVTLTLPRGVSAREGLEFAQEKAAWLRAHLDKRPEEIAVSLGSELPVSGQMRRIEQGSGRRVVLGEGVLLVPGAAERVGARLQGFLKQAARDRLAAASDHYSAQLGRPYHRLTLRDTRSRWGSCTSQGGLMYSWRLIMAPPEVLDYVAAHEVAHLAEMNHSTAFWDLATELYGDTKSARRWLREQGPTLHRYRF